MDAERRLRPGLPLLLTGMLVVGACGRSGPAPTAPAVPPAAGSGAAAEARVDSGPAAEATTVPLERLRITFPAAIALYAPLYVAFAEGFFRRHGLDVDLAYVDVNVSSPALLSGEIDAMFSSGQLAVSMGAAGSDVVLLGCLDNVSSDYVIMAQPNLRGVTELRDKLIGVGHPADMSVGYLAVVLERHGLSLNDVQFRGLGGQAERRAALESRLVDSVILSAPHDSMLERDGFSRVLNVVDLRLPAAGRCVVSTRRNLAARRQALEGVVKAIVEAEHFVKTQPERTMAVMSQYSKEENPETLRLLWQSIAPWGAKVPLVSLEGLRFQAAFTATVSNAPQIREFDVASMVDESIVRELERSGFIEKVYAP